MLDITITVTITIPVIVKWKEYRLWSQTDLGSTMYLPCNLVKLVDFSELQCPHF